MKTQCEKKTNTTCPTCFPAGNKKRANTLFGVKEIRDGMDRSIDAVLIDHDADLINDEVLISNQDDADALATALAYAIDQVHACFEALVELHGIEDALSVIEKVTANYENEEE